MKQVPSEIRYDKTVIWEPRLVCVEKGDNFNEIELSNARFASEEFGSDPAHALDDHPITNAEDKCSNDDENINSQLLVDYAVSDAESLKVEIYPRLCPAGTRRCDYYDSDTGTKYREMTVSINGNLCHQVVESTYSNLQKLISTYSPVVYECANGVQDGNQLMIESQVSCISISKIRVLKMKNSDLTPLCPCSNGTPGNNYQGTTCDPNADARNRKESCTSCDPNYQPISSFGNANKICVKACVCSNGQPEYNYDGNCDADNTQSCYDCDDFYRKWSYWNEDAQANLYKCKAVDYINFKKSPKCQNSPVKIRDSSECRSKTIDTYFGHNFLFINSVTKQPVAIYEVTHDTTTASLTKMHHLTLDHLENGKENCYGLRITNPGEVLPGSTDSSKTYADLGVVTTGWENVSPLIKNKERNSSWVGTTLQIDVKHCTEDPIDVYWIRWDGSLKYKWTV